MQSAKECTLVEKPSWYWTGTAFENNLSYMVMTKFNESCTRQWLAGDYRRCPAQAATTVCDFTPTFETTSLTSHELDWMWTLLSTRSPFISLGQGSLIGHSLQMTVHEFTPNIWKWMIWYHYLLMGDLLWHLPRGRVKTLIAIQSQGIFLFKSNSNWYLGTRLYSIPMIAPWTLGQLACSPEIA